MTRQGSFKRAARRQARESGEKYTKVRADMERDELQKRISQRVPHAQLRAHLEQRYGISISALTPFDGDHPNTFRVDREGGASWVARGFASVWRPVERAEGDAEILRFLEAQGYPAERLAHPEPVSAFEGQGILVTEFVEGVRPGGDVETQRSLGDLLGRLHALPLAGGAMARDGGAFGHDTVHEGRPAQDLAAAMNFLNVVEDKVAPANRAKFESLRETVASAETCEGLPEALTHPNIGPFNLVVRPDGERVVVAWCAAGRGPRIATLAWLLWGAGSVEHASAMGTAELKNPATVDAIVSAYATHVRPTDEELSRLPGAMMMRSLYMAGWYYWSSIASGYQPSGGEGWWPRTEIAEAIAERAVAAFRSGARTPRNKKPAEEYGTSSRSTVLDRYRRNADAFETLIASTPPGCWEQPSPCEGWSARNVVAHVVDHTRRELRRRGVKPKTAPSVRKDPLAAFRATRADLERLLADPERTQEDIHYLDAALSFDLPQHWWDLAKATGQDATMDPEFVRSAWQTLSRMTAAWWDWQRGNKHYGPEIAVPNDAPLQDRLLGLLGRNPNWAADHGARNAPRRLEVVMSRPERIVRDVLHLEPRKIQAVPTQSGERVHRVVTDERIVYVKHGRTAETGGRFRLEAWAHEQCRAKGVVVPEVLAASEPGEEIDFMATLPLAGRPLEQLATAGKPTVSGDAMKPILRAAGEQLRAMHEIRVDGFGPIAGAPPRGAYPHWCPFIDMARDALPYLVEEGVVSRDEATSLDAQFAEAQSTLRKDTPGRLLHGDLEGDHLFSNRGRFTGFLDFEKLQSGDPFYDLARLAWWDPHMLPDVLDGYGRDTLTADDLNVRMPAYLIANAVVGAAYGKSAWLAPADVRRNPIRHAQGAAQFIGAARARDFTALVEGRRQAATPAPQSELQILTDNVNGKTNDQIASFANGVGGFRVLCDLVFQGMKRQMKPKDCNVGFVLGDDLGWVFRASAGKNTIARRVPKRAPAIVHASPADFLRMITRDLDWEAAMADGRVKIEGDAEHVTTLFAGSSQG